MRFYSRALSYFRPDASGLVVSLLCVLVTTGLGLLQVYPLAILADNVLGPYDPHGLIERDFAAIAPSGQTGQILMLALIVLGLRLVQELLQMGQALLNIRIGYAGVLRLRCQLYAKLQQLSLAQHRARPQGDAIYRLAWDTSGVQTLLNVLVQTVLVSAATLIIMAGIMFALNWRLTLASLAVMPPLLWTTRRYNRILAEHATAAKEVESQLTSTIQRSVSTMTLVQAFGREADEYKQFSAVADSSVSAYLALHWHELFFWLLIGVTFAAGGAAIFGYGGYLIHRDQFVLHAGAAGMTIGKLTIFLAYLAMLYNPLKALAGSGAMLASGAAGVRRVFELLDQEPAIADAPHATPLPLRPRTLGLDHVCFGYRSERAVLDDITLTIAPGEMVAFVGASGAGKTTLLNLLPRFYDPTSGTIRLDDHDLRTVRLRDVRRHVALVLQESIVLPATVRENIAYGRPDATDAQIRHAAVLAGAADFIEALPLGYDEPISESGQNLSGGQRQRIAIARALLADSPIVVLDEPTSALDPQREGQLVQTLQSLKRQRTIVLVSHRLSTVAGCDQIFVMDNGQIVERGTHNELLQQGGTYWAMAQSQMLGGSADSTPNAAERSLAGYNHSP